MNRYIIISEHTTEDCRIAVKHFLEFHASFMTHFEWGCYDNDHHAYVIIEANSHEEAKLAVPPLFRDKAKVIKVAHLKSETVGEKIHS